MGVNDIKILIACERSGVVRDAFNALGHDAWSCDLVDSPGNHIVGNAISVAVLYRWDMMIAHPPCTYLCSSGLHWNKRRPERVSMTEDAVRFVFELMEAPIHRIAIENPVGCISTRIRKPEQIVQPWQFGHPESKATCLWLKNLPPLVHTNVLGLPECGHWNNQTPSGQNKLGPSKDRWMKRSLTYQGIADAMAEQWG